jgi:membrane-associated phospholipid phosphatase
MPEMSRAVIELTATKEKSFDCPARYDLRGPQVEPESSFWLDCIEKGKCPAPRPVTIAELRSRVNPAAHPYPTNANELEAELEELVVLARQRDEGAAVAHVPCDSKDTRDVQRLRLPLSMFLQLRPQPLGSVINTARGDSFPVINTGRELARYVENETPGLPHQTALNYMSREEMWSPPRQAWIWAALHVTIYSALAAAWYFKWRGGKGVEFRPRPWECFNELDVLYDRLPNSTASADGARRGFPPPFMPEPAHPGEYPSPESFVPDVTAPMPSLPTPGTPRHPAYPSGHSTYSAAASRLLIEFFPRYREQLCRLADNIGLGRMWAGIHWRSDHTFGQTVGTAVAELIIEQLRGTGIPRFTGCRDSNEMPKPPSNPCKPGDNWQLPDAPDLALCQEMQPESVKPTRRRQQSAPPAAARRRRR